MCIGERYHGAEDNEDTIADDRDEGDDQEAHTGTWTQMDTQDDIDDILAADPGSEAGVMLFQLMWTWVTNEWRRRSQGVHWCTCAAEYRYREAYSSPYWLRTSGAGVSLMKVPI